MQGQSHRRIDLGNAGATPEVSWHNGAQYYSLNQPLVSPCMLNKGYQLGAHVQVDELISRLIPPG